MPISDLLPKGRRAEAGFTLVELMVVLAIMALAAAAVVLTLPRGDHALRDEADRLAARLAAVRDVGVVEGYATAAVIGPTGYAFERRVRGQWQGMQGRAFAAHDWPRSLLLSGAAGPRRISFSRLGTSARAERLVLQSGDAQEVIHITANGDIRRAR
jgi:general secretion pathway protein H